MAPPRLSESPPFWWEARNDWKARLLYPASLVYGLVAARNLRRAKRKPIACPVLCVGNFTVGGAGKTPVAIAIAKAARARGFTPGILSRGHGGSVSGPHLVNLLEDQASYVGDEPLLLAEHAPVAISPDRQKGAALLLKQGCDFLIMDDGFQSAHIHIDFALLVVDALRGIGNGQIIPAGPLRAPMVAQLRHTDALLVTGEGTGADALVRQAARAARPVYFAKTVPVNGQELLGQPLLAFSGIGHNEKFFASLRALGATLVEERGFADHHFYEEDELADLEASARRLGATLVTTAKDAARLRQSGPLADRLLEELKVLNIETRFEEAQTLDLIFAATLESYQKRRLANCNR